MKIEKVTKHQLPMKALQHLKRAHERTPNPSEEFWTFLDCGEFYIFDDGETGACYIEWPNNILNIVLLGVDNLKDHNREVYDFFIGLMKERDSKLLCVIGRPGWDRLFPELINQGTLYTLGGS